MPSSSPWDCDDALTALFLFLGPEAVCSVGAVSPDWRARSADSKLWSLFFPSCKLALGPDSINRPLKYVRDGKRLAVSELGNRTAIANPTTHVKFVDLCGDIVALCEGAPLAGGLDTVEVYDLASRIKRRYDKVIRGSTALKCFEEGGRHLVVAGASPRQLIMIDFRAKHEDNSQVHAFAFRPHDQETSFDTRVVDNNSMTNDMAWLARAGKGRIIAAPCLCPCRLYLFGEQSGKLILLTYVSLDFPELVGVTCSDMAWAIDNATSDVRLALTINVSESLNPPCEVYRWASNLNEGSGFAALSPAVDQPRTVVETLGDPIALPFASNSRVEGEVIVPPNSPESEWSSVESNASMDVFDLSVALGLDFLFEDTVLVKSSWISRPLMFVGSLECSHLRYSSGALYGVVSFSFGSSSTNDSIAIAEISSHTGDIRRTFELPQIAFDRLTNYQWIGPLLSIVEPTGVLHIFSFEFSAKSDFGCSTFEGFRVLTSYGTCTMCSDGSSQIRVCKGLGTCHINCTGSGSLEQVDTGLRFEQENQDPRDDISGLWLVLGVCNGEQYRYNLRLTHENGRLAGGGHDMSLKGTAELDSQGKWQLEFKQIDGGSDYACDCHCVSIVPEGSPMKLHGTWKDTSGQHGSFIAVREISDIVASFPHPYIHTSWAAFGHRFAFIPTLRQSVVLCEWPKPFAFCA